MKNQTRYLLPVVVIILSVLAFAGWRMWGGDQENAGQWPALDGGAYAEAVKHEGLKYLLPPNQVYATGLTPEDRPALNLPKMVDIATADARLADELEGIAVTVGTAQYFYPFQILNWHEIVNDDLNGQSLAITYSPLSGSAVVYRATAPGETGEVYQFSDAGKTYNNTLLMTDTRGTIWNQTTGQAVIGEEVGQRLTVYPSAVMSFATWKDLYPSGLVLSTDTGYARDYGRHPYANYETSPGIFFPLNHTYGLLEPKALVYRVDFEGQSLVYVKTSLAKQADLNSLIGNGETDLFVVAFEDTAADLVRVFDRTTAAGVLTFKLTEGKLVDDQTGSRWSPEGVAVAGELKGTVLTEIPVTRHYSFAHFAMYPASMISGEDVLKPAVEAPEGQDVEIN